MKHIAKILPLAGLALAPMAANADTIFGIFAGGQYWNGNADGSISAFEPQVQLGNYDDQSETFSSYYVALQHPVPLIPNFKARWNDMTVDGEGINPESDFSHVDYILYYEIFDNDIVSIDLGVNAKRFDGNSSYIVADSTVTPVEFSGTVPMAYAATKIGLPFTSWWINAEASAISFDDSDIRDISASVEYQFLDNAAVDASVSLGYRDMEIKLDDIDDTYSDVRFSGPYLSVDVHF